MRQSPDAGPAGPLAAADLARLLADPAAPMPATPAGWEALLGLGRRAMLLATLAERWAAAGRLDQVPDAPRRHLVSARMVGARLAHEVQAEIGRIHEALAARGHRVVLLKGAAYLAAGLPPAAGRLFADVDLLAPRATLPAVEEALFAAGWLPSETDAYNQRYYREWMHEIPPLRHALRATTIDLHHTVTPPTSAFCVDGARLWAELRPLPGALPLWVLAPVDMVLHSAVHLFTEGEFDHGLRDLWDLHQLITHFAATEDAFWPRLLDRAEALALGVPLHHALAHAGRLFGTAPPAALAGRVAALAPGPLPRALMARLLQVALEPTPAEDRGTGEAFARWLLYVRSHWLRMPPHLLVPHLVRKAWMRRFPPPSDTAPVQHG